MPEISGKSQNPGRRPLPEGYDDPAIPEISKAMFAQMERHVAELDLKIDAIDRQLLEQHKANAVSHALRRSPASGQSPRSPWRFP